jgi:excisionase family DNA binding protein
MVSCSGWDFLPAADLCVVGHRGSVYHGGPSSHPCTDIAVEIYAVLREEFQHLKDGQAISLIPDDTLLTTQQDAEILNISRPYLYRLLDAGEIPFVPVGMHRKLRLADVQAVRERRRNESRKALNAITAHNQECDDYSDD